MTLRRLRLRAGRCGQSRTAGPSTVRCGSSWNVRWPWPIGPTTRRCSEHDGRWTVQGDPTEGALLVAARKAGLQCRGARHAASAGRRSAVLVGTQADEHASPRRGAAGARGRLHKRGARRAPARCRSEARWRRPPLADALRGARRSCRSTRGCRRRSAHARRRVSRRCPAARARGTDDGRRARRAGPRVRRARSA